MPHLYRDGRLVTTAAVASRGERFYLARRSSDGAQPLRWEFPGGKCDQDDTEHGCLERELREELQIASLVGAELGSTEFHHKDIDYILVAYAVEFLDEPRCGVAHVEDGWFTVTELRALDLADSDRALVQRLFGAEDGVSHPNAVTG